MGGPASRANRKCIVANCDRPYYGRGYCLLHWDRLRHGRPLEPAPRFCIDCNADISTRHFNSKRCEPCQKSVDAKTQKRCVKNKYQTDPEWVEKERKRRRESQRVYVAKNREKVRAKAREDYQKKAQDPTFRAKENERNRERYRCLMEKPGAREKRNEKSRERMRELRADPENRKKINEQYNEWQRNKYATDEEWRAKKRKRQQARDPWRLQPEDIDRQMELQKGQCAICKTPLGDVFHLDHIIPLSKGGASTAKNMQITCPTCNLAKGAGLTYTDSEGQGVMALGFVA